MSFVTRLWNAIRNPIRCVGRDLEGNRFYERPSPNNVTRTTRSVQYRDPEDMWKYTGGGKRLPIQWSAWLTHTRPHPPTIEELQADIARQQRVLANVALIEARDRTEDQERLRLRQEDAQKALQRASSNVSSSGEYLLEGSGTQNDPTGGTNATASDIHGEPKLGPEGEVKEVANPELDGNALAQANGLKIRPPTFLTPVKSSKSQPRTPIYSSVFTTPLDVSSHTGHLMQNSLERERQCQQKKAEMGLMDTAQSANSDSAGIQKRKSTDVGNPLPAMPSRVTETESWAPKARIRGR